MHLEACNFCNTSSIMTFIATIFQRNERDMSLCPY